MRWKATTTTHLTGVGVVGAILMIAGPTAAILLSERLVDVMAQNYFTLRPPNLFIYRAGIWASGAASIIGLVMVLIGRRQKFAVVDQSEPDFATFGTPVDQSWPAPEEQSRTIA
ncbi:MAG: hypothetical protein KIS96_03705 [Bauldia sp.]|nr:hypothetical protein [Bauldia sp.]